MIACLAIGIGVLALDAALTVGLLAVLDWLDRR